MKDIKISKNVGIEYIPKNRRLCINCLYFEICPYDHKCKAHEDLIAFEEEFEEL